MPLSDDDKQLLAEWARHPGAEIARRWLIEQKRAEEATLGKQLFADPASFDPVEVARQSGRHSGRLEVLNQALFAAKAIEREQQKATEESE
jgi:hypothetical protein